MKLLILLCVGFGVGLAAEMKIVDKSFADFCSYAGGQLVYHNPINGILTQGEECKEANFAGIYASSDAEAELSCKSLGPFHLTKSGRNTHGFIQCDFENLFICRPAYTQIRGKCYKMFHHAKTYQEGEKMCRDSAGNSREHSLYFHTDDKLGDWIQHFFEDLTTVWARVAPEGQRFIEASLDTGPNYAVSYLTSEFFNVRYGSLIKIGDDDLAMVICEYVPEDTYMSLSAKIKIWQPFIHPAVISGQFVAWRTFNHPMPDFMIHGSIFKDHQNQCKASLSALADPSNAKLFDPTKTQMKVLAGRLKENMLFLAPFRVCRYAYWWCSASSAWKEPNTNMTHCGEKKTQWLYGGDYDTSQCRLCETNASPKEFALAVYLLVRGESDDDTNYMFQQTRRKAAPFLCDFMFRGVPTMASCPQGFWTFERTDGTRACHIRIEQSVNREQAREICAKRGAYLGGWNDHDEMMKIKNSGTGWLGLKKRQECRYANGAEGTNCHISRIFYDDDKMTTENGMKFLQPDGLFPEQPEGSAEYCTTIHTYQGNWIHDWGCQYSFAVHCTKLAEWTYPPLKYTYDANLKP
ncbi:unnamed protein product [Caenorhabditis angaria]|uniref:C-type lectin domain-containing protein n=1 Tax=Caenorhabditis angaria TaxID=860376 RepID=A0A9P1IEX4_9PELO|nr:unnamed protein product [Caenorhabditis angaria]